MVKKQLPTDSKSTKEYIVYQKMTMNMYLLFWYTQFIGYSCANSGMHGL